MVIAGLHTALITPFQADGSLDLAAVKRLLDQQLHAGVQGVVVGGSTGEAATLTLMEKEVLWRTAVDHVAGRMLVVAGTGTNATSTTVEASVMAQRCGADALLVVTPYYNKPTRSGLLAHHSAIADATPLPQILYNIPGRSGLNMSAETQLALAEAVPTVVATKEASANLEQMGEIIRNAPDTFSLLAGDDVLALPVIALGGTGVIAVMSNYAPVLYGRLVHAALQGDISEAQRVQEILGPWYQANFIETNPLPVKYIMHVLHGIELRYRLPLTTPTDATQATLRTMLEGAQLA